MEIEDRIRKANLKVTRTRSEILALFVEKDYALSYADIDASLKGSEDKVTIYRTLKSFSEKGIIHEIMDVDKVSKYALCGHKCSSEHHHDTHAHFKCLKCKHIFCLQKPKIEIEIPANYQATTFNLSIEGLCNNCSN